MIKLSMKRTKGKTSGKTNLRSQKIQFYFSLPLLLQFSFTPWHSFPFFWSLYLSNLKLKHILLLLSLMDPSMLLHNMSPVFQCAVQKWNLALCFFRSRFTKKWRRERSERAERLVIKCLVSFLGLSPNKMSLLKEILIKS